MAIKPLGTRILVKPIKEDATVQSAGLVEIDEDFRAPQSIKAEVVAVGNIDVKSDIQVGDIILCSQFAPTQVKEKPGDPYVIVPVEDVLAVIVPDTAA